MIQAIKFIIYLKQSTYVCGALKTRVRQKDCSNKKLNYFVRLFLSMRTFFAIFDLIGVGERCWRRYILVTESLSPVLSPRTSFLKL